MSIYCSLRSVTIISILSLLWPFALFGQTSNVITSEVKQYNNVLTIVPQYAFVHGLRIDYERRLKTTDQWIVLAPQIFSDINNNTYYFNGDYSAYQSMFGMGINVYYKVTVFKSKRINLNSNLPRQSLYFSAGPNFQYFSLRNVEEVAHPFVEDGVTYYKFELEEVKKHIYRIGGTIDVGWQVALDRFVFDFYLGMTMKYSLDNNGEIIRDSYSNWIDPAYSGILLDGGLKLGFFF